MQIFEITAAGRRALSPGDLHTFEKPALVYFGCLHHLQDRGTDSAQFTNYLLRLRGRQDAHILMPVIPPTDLDELRAIRHGYNLGERGPSDLAVELYEILYRPVLDSADLSTPPARRIASARASAVFRWPDILMAQVWSSRSQARWQPIFRPACLLKPPVVLGLSMISAAVSGQ